MVRGRAGRGLCLLLAICWGSPAFAVGTRKFEFHTLDSLAGGDTKGVQVSTEGIVRPGYDFSRVPLQAATSVFAMLPRADGSTLIATGPTGRVFRVAGDVASPYADTGTLAVTSLVEWRGATYAGTTPEGKVFRLSEGKAELFAKLPDTSHVWALAVSEDGGSLFAGTGPDGKVFRLAPGGQASVYLETNEQHIVSLAGAAGGVLFAGSSGKGLVYRITGLGRASVLFDVPGEEAKALVLGKSGQLYVISNDYGDAPEPGKKGGAAGRTPAAPSTSPRPKPGKGVLTRFDLQGRPERMMRHEETHYTALSVDEAGVPYVGTGADGRVYTVDDAHRITMVADLDSRQVGALALPAGRAMQLQIAASDPTLLHRTLSYSGPSSTWTSKVLDAGLVAKFGHVEATAFGRVELSARTGNTPTPDNTWSPWAALAGARVISSPPGRFLQLRAALLEPEAELRDIEVAFLTQNLRPVVTEVSVQPKSATVREVKDALPASGGEPPKHDNVLKVSWKVDNFDSDSLRYRLACRREGQSLWRPVTHGDDTVTKTEFEWDTLGMPEGKYRVRVEASDESANPPEHTQKHALESAPVTVDNTPPVLESLRVVGRRLQGRAVDGLGPVARVEVSVDADGNWRPINAADGLLDSASEGIDADISSLVPAGPHIVAVRVFDESGNSVIREVETR